jgi:hypothetical protein
MMRVRSFSFAFAFGITFFCLIGGLLFAMSGEQADTGAGAPRALNALLQTLRDAVDPLQARQDVQTIWETDRWFTFPKFEETAEHVAAMMRRAGLEEVEIGKPPADGVTQAGFWTMPLAWDAKAGTLEIVEPRVPEDQRVLADYQRVPSSLCMWSGPTPGGADVITEVVDAPEHPEGAGAGSPNLNLAGKLVLGRRGSKTALAKAGVLGIISDTTENPDLADDRGWVNSFGDNGWGFSKGNAPLVCFSISPRGTRLLRDLMAKGPVKVRARVDTRYYAGVYPYVTGVIRGTDGANAEEVLSLGHLFEQGAHDNATGFSSILNAAATLNRLIAAGTLPRPKRTIRVLGMGECYGTNYYLEHHADRTKRTIAAMCIDSPAGLQTLAGTEHTWILNPHAASSYVDALVLRIAESYYPMVGRPWQWVEHRSSTDNYLGDPTIGIPTVMPRGGYGVLAHHNSADRPETVDQKSLRDLMVMNAAYTYLIASAGPAERRWMAEVALTRAYTQVAAFASRSLDRIAAATTAAQLSELLAQGYATVDYTRDRESRAVQSAADLPEGLTDLAQFADRQRARIDRAVQDRAAALRLGHIAPAPPPQPQHAEAAHIVVRRTRLGTITLDDLPAAEREGFPAASFWGVPVSALYWCDGKRTLAEVIRLTELEMGPQTFDFAGYFRFLEKHGYVEFVRANQGQ